MSAVGMNHSAVYHNDESYLVKMMVVRDSPLLTLSLICQAKLMSRLGTRA